MLIEIRQGMYLWQLLTIDLLYVIIVSVLVPVPVVPPNKGNVMNINYDPSVNHGVSQRRVAPLRLRSVKVIFFALVFPALVLHFHAAFISYIS
jgi:hypothetical protein